MACGHCMRARDAACRQRLTSVPTTRPANRVFGDFSRRRPCPTRLAEMAKILEHAAVVMYIQYAHAGRTLLVTSLSHHHHARARAIFHVLDYIMRIRLPPPCILSPIHAGVFARSGDGKHGRQHHRQQAQRARLDRPWRINQRIKQSSRHRGGIARVSGLKCAAADGMQQLRA